MTKKFSPSRERSERLDNALSRLFTHNAQPTTDLKCTLPTASGPPRSSGDLDQEHQDQPAKRNWRDLENLRLEVRGQRSEERKDLGFLTSILIPLTSVPPCTKTPFFRF